MKEIKIYLDLDGTICGEDKWTSFWHNTTQLFKTGLLMEIPKQNWNILTARPKIDRLIIKRVCFKYGLYPDEIITSESWFYTFKDDNHVANWKASFLSKKLNNESLFVSKIIYCDNNPNILSNMNTHPDLILCKPKLLKKIIEDLKG